LDRHAQLHDAPAIGAFARAFVAAAVVVAFVERWWFPYAWRETTSLTSVFYYGDATRFVAYARAIAQGRVYDNGIPFHPPGWPLLLAGLFHATGATGGPVPVSAIKLLTAALGALTVGAAALLAGEVAGSGALIAAAVLLAFDFGHIVESTVANSEALYGLLVTLAAAAAWRWLRDAATHPRAWAALAGVLAGAASLVRAEFLAAAVVWGAWAWMRRRARVDLLLYAAAMALVLTPTTIWHWRTLSAFNAAHVGRVAGPLPRFAPVTSYGPFNFAMANHEDADGVPNRDHPMLDRCQGDTSAALEAGQLDLACPAAYDLYVHGYEIGALWLLNNPGAALRLVGRKLAFTVGCLGQGFFVDDLAVGVDGVRRRVDLVDPANWWLIPIRLALLIVGLVALKRRPAALAVVGGPLVALVASAVLFYGYVRLGVAYLPVAYVLIGAGAAWVAQRATGRFATRRTMAAALLTMALVLVYERTARDADRRLLVDGPRLADGTLNQDETVEIRRSTERGEPLRLGRP